MTAVVVSLPAGGPERSSTFRPAGEGAEQILPLTWTMILLGTAVFVVVCGLWLFAMLRGRGDAGALPAWARGNRLLIIGGVLPTVVVVGLMVAVVVVINRVDAIGDRDPVKVRVVAHKFWWDVDYVDEGIRTANELQVPVGRDVEIELVSDDVIHSFWAPSLGQKVDLVPGQVNRLSLRPTVAGTYQGYCAEYCGLQHARMQFTVISLPLGEWDEWVRARQRAVAAGDDERRRAGFARFVAGGCAQCHRIAGTTADQTVGPDLTHFAQRRTLAASQLDNTRENLRSWIVDPDQHKPGVLMPPLDGRLDDTQLDELLDYLRTPR